jgi:tetratricopeptide (TPR) repeat protein
LHDIGDLDRALETLDTACEIEPSDAFAHSARGSILADMERYDDAQAAHETAIKLNELHPNIWNTYGSHLSDQGSLKEAERAFRKAIELHEGKIWIDPYTNLTKVLFRQGRNNEASEILDIALTMTPLSYIDFVDLGTLLLGFNRIEEANGMAEEALGLVPDGFEGIIVRSAALRALGQLELMKTVFDKMNEIGSKEAASWSHIASCLHDAGLLPEAREAIDQAMELEPRNGEFRHEFAVVLMKEGDFDAAEREFKVAFKLGHKTEACWIDRALSLRKAGKYKKSERLLLDYLHENSGSSRAWFGIGLDRTSTKNIEGATEAYAEAVKINPAYHEAWNNMGNSFRRLGRLEEAANAFREAVKQKEDYARAWLHLADVLMEMCKWEEAEKAAFSAFGADPSVYGFDIIMKKLQERRYGKPG